MIIAEDRLTGEMISVRAMDTAYMNGGVSDGIPTSILREIVQN